MNTRSIVTWTTTLLATSGACAGITSYTDTSSMLTDITNSADFNGLAPGQSLVGYEEDGFRLNVNRTYFSWDAPGLDGSEMFYSNTGALELVEITMSNGEDFRDVDMQISSGWTQSQVGLTYIWAQLYDDGQLVGEFDVDMVTGSYLGLAGGGFDQILIGSYVTASIRDAHNSNERNAIAIDNLRQGTLVPAPGAALLLGMGSLAFTRRTRES